MKEMAERVIAQYGSEMLAGERKIRGFLWAVNANSWQSTEEKATALGEISRGQYGFLVGRDGGLQEGDTLALGEKTYLVRRVETYIYQGQPIYCWGLCVEKGVNDIWGSQS